MADLEKMSMDIRMKAKDYELMNAPKNRKATMYGKLFVDVDASLRGPVDELKMRGNMNVQGKTDLTYVLKESPLAVNDRLGDMVTFVNFNDTTSIEPDHRLCSGYPPGRNNKPSDRGGTGCPPLLRSGADCSFVLPLKYSLSENPGQPAADGGYGYIALGVGDCFLNVADGLHQLGRVAGGT